MIMEFVRIGNVGRPHGVFGGFFVGDRDAGLSQSLVDLEVFVGKAALPGVSYKVSKQKNSGGRTVLHFAGMGSREQVGEIKGQSLFLKRADVSLDPASEYLWQDLVGQKVIDKDGVEVGIARSVMNYGASDILRIEHEERGILLVPLVGAYFAMDLLGADAPYIKLEHSLEIFADTWETA